MNEPNIMPDYENISPKFGNFLSTYGYCAMRVTVLAIIFKLVGIIDMPWMYIAIPTVLPFAVMIAFGMLFVAGAILALPAILFCRLISSH